MATITFYGKLGDIAGRALTRPLPSRIATVGALKEWLGRDNETLASALRERGVRIAVGGTLADDEARVCDGDEIAVMPPFSGG